MTIRPFIEILVKPLGRLLKLNFSRDFAFLFFEREGTVLLGKRFNNFWFLVIIFSLTFFALGFAKGSLSYLKEKMNLPFMKWVTINVPYKTAQKIPTIVSDLNVDSKIKEQFKFKEVTGCQYFMTPFWDKRLNDHVFKHGRTIEKNNSLLTEILGKHNKVRGKPGVGFKDNSDIGLIVTERFLKSLSYDINTPFILSAFSDPSDTSKSKIRYYSFPLPIVAVVKELPGLVDFLATPYFFQQRSTPSRTSLKNPFDPSNSSGIDFLIFDKNKKVCQEKARELSNALEKFFRKVNPFSVYNPTLNAGQLPEYNLSYIPGFQVPVIFSEHVDFTIRKNIFQAIRKDKEVGKFNYVEYLDYMPQLEPYDSTMQLQLDKLAINFENFDEIRPFNRYLLDKYELEIEMSQIESLENYNFISQLSQIISLILIGFSISSIILFITNLLRNHLEKIKMNIGTFTAFGINQHSLERIYLGTVFCFITIAMTLAFTVTWIFGYAGGVRLILMIFRKTIEPGETYFDLFSWYTLASVILVFISSYIALKYITKRVFKNTPGDLIYDRV